MTLGLGILGWSPDAFWRASPRELAAAAGLATGRAMERGTLDALIAAHPDTPAS